MASGDVVYEFGLDLLERSAAGLGNSEAEEDDRRDGDGGVKKEDALAGERAAEGEEGLSHQEVRSQLTMVHTDMALLRSPTGKISEIITD
ncbi:hypothetical protein GCM10009843_01290 [Nocardioides bigeumensis]|uniref:Uncharacterized protein n=1 Tax=Nocardioides bigeumensis TaxID=433657 RepID=A0ABN2XMH1_9ACTN